MALDVTMLCLAVGVRRQPALAAILAVNLLKAMKISVPFVVLILLLSACAGRAQLRPTPLMRNLINTNTTLTGLKSALGINAVGASGLEKTNGTAKITSGNQFSWAKDDGSGSLGTIDFAGHASFNFIESLGTLTADGNANITLTATADGIVASSTLRSDGSNYFAKSIMFSTNQNQMKPDFSLSEQLMSTNAAFTFLAPVGVDSTKTGAQWHLVNVTNTTAVAVLMTSPANVHTVGTPYVTNWSYIWFHCYAGKITNAIYTPVF